MNLRKYKLSPADLAEAKASLFYQPFRISEEIQSGIAYDWIYNKGVFQVDRREVDAETWKTFDALNHNLRTAYDGWLDAIAAGYGDLRNASVLDVACAEGYFLHGLKQRGAGRCIGYDIASSPSVSTGLLNRLLGHDVEFRNIAYDMRFHMVPGAEPADIVISSAIMVHMSDPTFFLEFLGSMAKRLLFIYSAFEDTDVFRVTYEGPRLHHDAKAKFPLCFSGRTMISTSLFHFAMNELGFTRVIEAPQLVRLPPEPYRAYIAIKD